MIDNVIKGYNSTILAYGVTGTGKTHTMFGNLHAIDDSVIIEKGMCIYAIDYLFERLRDKTSYIKVGIAFMTL
jgi:kinesin family protein 18/19